MCGFGFLMESLFRCFDFCTTFHREAWRGTYFVLELYGEHHEVVCTSATHAKARKCGGLVGTTEVQRTNPQALVRVAAMHVPTLCSSLPEVGPLVIGFVLPRFMSRTLCLHMLFV